MSSVLPYGSFDYVVIVLGDRDDLCLVVNIAILLPDGLAACSCYSLIGLLFFDAIFFDFELIEGLKLGFYSGLTGDLRLGYVR